MARSGTTEDPFRRGERPIGLAPERRVTGEAVRRIELGRITGTKPDDLPPDLLRDSSKTVGADGDDLRASVHEVAVERPIALDLGRFEPARW